jgi:hypothetical protein
VRGENKELKNQLSEYSKQLNALQEQLKALANPPKPAEAEAEPDFLSDPKAYVDKAKESLTKTQQQTAEALKKLEEHNSSQAEQAKQQQELQIQWNEVLTKQAEFAAATPDYQAAIDYVRGIRTKAFTAEFEAMNDRAPTVQEISQALAWQERQGALELHKKGKNPAEWYYSYAKAIGYVKAADPESAADPAKPEPKQQKPPAKPDKEAVKSMGSGGGNATPPDEDPNRDPMASLLGAVHGEMTAKRKARRAS